MKSEGVKTEEDFSHPTQITSLSEACFAINVHPKFMKGLSADQPRHRSGVNDRRACRRGLQISQIAN